MKIPYVIRGWIWLLIVIMLFWVFFLVSARVKDTNKRVRDMEWKLDSFTAKMGYEWDNVIPALRERVKAGESLANARQAETEYVFRHAGLLTVPVEPPERITTPEGIDNYSFDQDYILMDTGHLIWDEDGKDYTLKNWEETGSGQETETETGTNHDSKR